MMDHSFSSHEYRTSTHHSNQSSLSIIWHIIRFKQGHSIQIHAPNFKNHLECLHLDQSYPKVFTIQMQVWYIMVIQSSNKAWFMIQTKENMARSWTSYKNINVIIIHEKHGWIELPRNQMAATPSFDHMNTNSGSHWSSKTSHKMKRGLIKY